jgi:hypothetical protein
VDALKFKCLGNTSILKIRQDICSEIRKRINFVTLLLPLSVVTVVVLVVVAAVVVAVYQEDVRDLGRPLHIQLMTYR